jgi:hypothetical protein
MCPQMCSNQKKTAACSISYVRGIRVAPRTPINSSVENGPARAASDCWWGRYARRARKLCNAPRAAPPHLACTHTPTRTPTRLPVRTSPLQALRQAARGLWRSARQSAQRSKSRVQRRTWSPPGREAGYCSRSERAAGSPARRCASWRFPAGGQRRSSTPQTSIMDAREPHAVRSCTAVLRSAGSPRARAERACRSVSS